MALESGAEKGLRAESTGIDCCWGVRALYTKVNRLIASTKTGAAIAVALPMVYVLIMLALAKSNVSVVSDNVELKFGVEGPLEVVMGITMGAGVIGLVAVYKSLQNLLGVAAWFFTVLGHTFLTSTVVIVSTVYSTFGADVTKTWVLMCLPSIVVWLVAAGIMDAHRVLVTEGAIASVGASRQAPKAEPLLSSAGAGRV